MICQASRAIKEELDRQGLNNSLNEGDTWSNVDMGINGKKNNYRIMFLSTDENNDVQARAYNILKVDDDHFDAIVELCNQLHEKYRFFKFYVDKNNQLAIGYDFPLATTAVGSCAMETVVRIARLVDDEYPAFMQVMWA